MQLILIETRYKLHDPMSLILRETEREGEIDR